jgi:hypothetical protein
MLYLVEDILLVNEMRLELVPDLALHVSMGLRLTIGITLQEKYFLHGI